MATKVYNTKTIELFNGDFIELMPLKIKYLRQLMEQFNNIKNVNDDNNAIDVLISCVLIAMKQYYPQVKTVEQVEDLVDLKMVYDILDYAANIKIKNDGKEDVDVKERSLNGEKGSGWDELDLAKLESEVFLLGIWKDYQELESSLSMPELMTTIAISRDLDYEEKKFLAAIQGVDLDKNSGKQNEWENLKAKVFSKGKATDAKDVLALQGQNARTAGFGIGMGLDYEDLTKK